MQDFLNKRIENLRQYMLHNEFDAVLITTPANMRYFSAFTGEGYVLLTNSKLIIVTDFRYTEQAREQSSGFEVFDSIDFDLKEFSKEFKKTGFENHSVSYSTYKSFYDKIPLLSPLDDALKDFRAVKSDEEIELISRAEHIGDMAFSHILDYIKPDVSERDIALEIEFFMRKNGAEALSFDTIVATGAHGAMPHAEPDERKISKGDFVVLDFGCKYKGYCSDMTRTVCVGKASEEMKKVYNTVLKAQLTSLDMLSAGINPSDVHKNALNIIDELYPKSFGHSLGHGVGLEIHENPTLSLKNTTLLKSGNVVTVEPGIYLNGFCGVRIEDVAVICDDGIQNITKSDKNLIEL